MAGTANKSQDIPAPQLAQRHQPSGLNSTFLGEGLSFAEYIALSQEMLRRAHTKLATPDIEKVIAGNMPFALQIDTKDGIKKPYRRGILLTHGLSDSPYFMRHLADFFHQQGFLVRAILLPGHGTQPGDLLDVTWQEWARAVAYGTDSLAQQVDEIYLGGLSTGATLSINQSLNDERVQGLFLFSPALKITPLAAFANAHKLYSYLVPGAKWVTIQPDTDLYKYESFPKNAAAQMHALTRVVHARLTTVHIPIFTVVSADDATVRTAATLEFMANTAHPSSKVLQYSTTPTALPATFPPHKIEQVNSVFPNQHIVSSSHLAIMLPASDTHYGSDGIYANCAHYYPQEIEKYSVCRTAADISLGEITSENLHTGIIRRLMFNPNFSGMLVSMQRFIASLTDCK